MLLLTFAQYIIEVLIRLETDVTLEQIILFAIVTIVIGLRLYSTIQVVGIIKFVAI